MHVCVCMHERINACVHQHPRTSISTHAYLLARQASEEEKVVLGQELAAAQVQLARAIGDGRSYDVDTTTTTATNNDTSSKEEEEKKSGFWSSR